MSGNGKQGPRRRPRYRGTHPRRFDQRYKELDPAKYPDIHGHVRAQGRTPAGTHVPIMLAEVGAALALEPGQIVADCTAGYGGHAEEFLKRIGPAGKLVAIDLDGLQLERMRVRLAALGFENVATFHGSFAGIEKAMTAAGVTACDAVFADLGVSSMQIDDPSRGFSYKVDGPLDMRMDVTRARGAAELLAKISEAELSAALAELGDEEDHAAIAAAVAAARARTAITHTRQLAEIVLAAKRAKPSHREAAARTFQTLRILVNDELSALRHLMRVAPRCLRPGGRLAVLTFHSGEDRVVKRAMREGLETGVYGRISDAPVQASAAERRDNPRSSAARLRWAVRAF